MEKTRKPRRSRIGGSRDILTVEAPPGKVYRWVNDVNERVARMIEDGWARVAAKDRQVGDRTVVNNNQDVGSGIRKHVGGDIHAVLLELDKEEYELRQSEYMAEAAKPMNEIKRRKNGGDGNYGSFDIK